MAVTIAGAGTVADGDADGFDGAKDIRVSGRSAAQVQNVIDSDIPFFRNRGNRTFDVSFSSAKRYADADAAKAAIGTHTAAVAAGTGFTGFGLSLVNVSCSVDCQLVGLVMIRNYKITGVKSGA